jgi:hypothetical protein
MADTVLDTIKARIKKATGGSTPASTYGIGFSGSDSVMVRVQNTTKAITSKGAMGTIQSIVKGEKPILSVLAPGTVKPTTTTTTTGVSTALFERFRPYKQDSQAVTRVDTRGYTKIGSGGN